MKSSYLLIFLCLVLTSLSHAQSGPTIDSLDQFIEAQAKRYHIPGIAACVIKGDQIIWSNAYGFANIEEALPMTTKSIMNIASISKTITATAVMHLWEKKSIELDTDINRYLPFKVRNPHHPDIPITIRQLLTHSSSINDGPSFKEGYQCGDPTTSLSDWISNYFSSTGRYYDAVNNFHKEAPGAMRDYSNVAFGLLGLIVEKVSQKPFHQYVKEQIFQPLQMDDTTYWLDQLDASRLVTPYLYLGPLQANMKATESLALPYFNPYCLYSFWNYPDGLVRTTVEDLAKFAIAIMQDGQFHGQQILQKETIELMHSPQLSKEINEDQDQGLSWFHSPSLDPSWFHGGSDPGVSTRMYVNKVDDLAVIVFQNANEDNAYYIIKKLYQAFHN